MVKLVPAKCPSCGAKLELDDNMKRAECEYCKNTIIVDDAIENYKLNVKVSDVKDYSDTLSIAKKHIKLGKYERAKILLENILDDDEYNLEALKEYVVLLLDHKYLFKEFTFNEYNYLDEINDKIHMIEGTDDDGKYKEFLDDVKQKAKDLEDEIKRKAKELEDENNRKNHNEKIGYLYEECCNYICLDKSINKRTSELQEHFKVGIISVDSLSNAVKENENEEIEYVKKLISNYYNKKKIKIEKEKSFKVIITVILSAVVLISEWSYIIKDIAESFSDPSLLTPLAALIFIALGIGASFLIVFLMFLIAGPISKLLVKLFVK